MNSKQPLDQEPQLSTPPQQPNQIQPAQSPLHRWLPTIVGVAIVVLAGAGFLGWNFLGKSEPESKSKTGKMTSVEFPATGESVAKEQEGRFSSLEIIPSRVEDGFILYPKGAKAVAIGGFAKVEFFDRDFGFSIVAKELIKGQWEVTLPKIFGGEWCAAGSDSAGNKQDEKCLSGVYSGNEAYISKRRNLAGRVFADLRSLIVALDFPSIDEKCTAPTITIEIGKPLICGSSTYFKEVPMPRPGFSYIFPDTVEISKMRSYTFIAEGFKDGGTLICSDGRCYCEQEGLCQY